MQISGGGRLKWSLNFKINNKNLYIPLRAIKANLFSIIMIKQTFFVNIFFKHKSYYGTAQICTIIAYLVKTKERN